MRVRWKTEELWLLIAPVAVLLAVLGVARLRQRLFLPRPTPPSAIKTTVSKLLPPRPFRPLKTLATVEPSPWHHLDYSSDGRFIITAYSEANRPVVRVWDTKTERLQHTLTYPNPDFSQNWCSCAASGDGKRVAVGGWTDNRVEIFDIASGKLLWRRKVSPNALCFELTHDGNGLWLAEPHSISLWNLPSNQKELTWQLPTTEKVDDIALRPHGKLAVLTRSGPDPTSRCAIWILPRGGHHPNRARLWQRLRLPDWENHAVYSMAFSPDETRLALAARNPAKEVDDGLVLIWNLRQARVEHNWRLPGAGEVGDLQWTPNGEFLLLGAGYLGAYSWHFGGKTGVSQRRYNFPDCIHAVALRPGSLEFGAAGVGHRHLVSLLP